MSRVFTLGETPIIKKPTSTRSADDALPKTREEIQAYVNSMSDNEKKEYIFFLVHKITEEKNKIINSLSIFEDSVKDLPIFGEVADFKSVIKIYDEVIIPMVRGVYVCSNPLEEFEMKALKKKIMGKLTLAHFDEYLSSIK